MLYLKNFLFLPIKHLLALQSYCKANEIQECSICWEKIETDINTTKCKHSFHKACLDQWLSMRDVHSCPNCRSILKSTFLTNEFPTRFKKFIDKSKKNIPNILATVLVSFILAIPLTNLVLKFRQPDFVALISIILMDLAFIVQWSKTPLLDFDSFH